MDEWWKKMVQQIGSHKNVFEYDGAFQCLDCKVKWGALPKNPIMPEECNIKEQPENTARGGKMSIWVIEWDCGEGFVPKRRSVQFATLEEAKEAASPYLKAFPNPYLKYRIAEYRRVEALNGANELTPEQFDRIESEGDLRWQLRETQRRAQALCDGLLVARRTGDYGPAIRTEEALREILPKA